MKPWKITDPIIKELLTTLIAVLVVLGIPLLVLAIVFISVLVN